MTYSLADALESFNRKERNLLVRDMLGKGEIPRLGKDYCKKIEETLGFEIPEDAWWATDYHIEWLAGALTLFVNGDETKPRENLENQKVNAGLSKAIKKTLISSLRQKIN